MAETAPKPEPWERQPGEPNRWFARFENYLRTGPGRSLLGAVNSERAKSGKHRQTAIPGSWSRAAAQWRWKARAEVWDEQERQKARETHARDIAEMNARHIQEAQALQRKAIERLKSLELNDISAADLARFIVEATKLERTARGEPEAIEERRLTGKGGGPIGFSLEDAVRASKELEDWHNDRVQPAGDGALPEGNTQMPQVSGLFP
jgi:hypothetical protein